MRQYRLDEHKLLQSLKEAGFGSLTEFARKNAVNRMTLAHYFKGQGPISESYYHLCQALKVDPLSLLSPVIAECELLEEIMPVVNKVIEQNKKLAVFLIGSRAKNTAKKYSDWDLGFTGGETPLATREYLRIKNLVEEEAENLPRLVDVVNLDQAPRWFLEAIDYQPIFLAGNQSAHQFFKGALYGIQIKR